MYHSFQRWAPAQVLDTLVDEFVIGFVMIDSTFMKVHQCAAGAP